MSLKYTNLWGQQNFFTPIFSTMTQEDVQKQIETIKKITQEALQTPESARKILVDAGIIKENKNITDNSNKLPDKKK